LVKRSVSLLINDSISERLKSALKTENEEVENKQKEVEPIEIREKENKIETTDEEVEGFFIIKSILRPHILCERITYRDAQTYFAIFVDGNNRKPICRFYFNNPANKQVAILDENKNEIRTKIETLDDIYNLSESLISSSKRYL